MSPSSSNHSGRRFGRREAKPVCSEPKLTRRKADLPCDFMPNSLQDSAAAERNARTAGRMTYDPSADHIDWYGIGTDRSRPLEPAYLPRSELYPRIAKDNRAYTVVSVVLGLMLATAASVVAVAWFVRAKPVTVERMPIVSSNPAVGCYKTSNGEQCVYLPTH